MTASSAPTKLVLLQAADRSATTTGRPPGAKIRRYRLARAHMQAHRTHSLAVATDAVQSRLPV